MHIVYSPTTIHSAEVEVDTRAIERRQAARREVQRRNVLEKGRAKEAEAVRREQHEKDMEMKKHYKELKRVEATRLFEEKKALKLRKREVSCTT